jgi:hypothetical protein
MANAALFIGWNRAVSGREAQALELFYTANQFWAQQQTEGRIEGFEQILLNPHAGDLNGFTIIRGDRNKLNTLKDSNDFQDLLVRAAFLLEGVGCVDAHVGESVMTQAQRYGKTVQSIK